MSQQAAAAIDRRAIAATRTRAPSADGSYVTGGIWVPENAEPVPIKAVVQPASGNQLMDVPEGIRTEARWLAWSRSELLVDDTVTVSSVSYRVLYAWPRTLDGQFHRAALGRLA